jgi:hypothetical protein
VDADRQWLGQRRMLRRKSVGHLQQQRLAEQHAFGVAADIVVGIADALWAVRHQQNWKRTHPRAGLELAPRVRSVVQNLAAEFVAEHDIASEIHRLAAREMPCQFDHAVGVLARMQVRAANTAGKRPDQYLPC